MTDPVLEVRGLSTRFDTADGPALAVDDFSLTLARGQTTCIVGESGCGKSVTSLSIMGLVPRPGQVIAGEVRLGGTDLRALGRNALSRMRGDRLSMIFQDPSSALNPVQSVGRQIAEVFTLHRGLRGRAATAAAVEMLAAVGIPDPARRMKAYPHELSGGMAQRVMIAMALACQPEVLIADEPTTALDVTIQAQILDLMRDLQRDFGTAILLITHDLGVVAEMADRVAVMYAGRIVEEAPVAQLFAAPCHPYTRALLRSMPELGARRERLEVIAGRVPALTQLPPGCAFAPRCREAAGEPRCLTAPPPALPAGPAQAGRCWRLAPPLPETATP